MALKFIGKMMQARRNVAENYKANQEAADTQRMVNNAKENYGKTSISKVDKSETNKDDFVDFEEIE